MDRTTESELLYMNAKHDSRYLRWLVERYLELEERHNTLAGELALSMRETRQLMKALNKKYSEIEYGNESKK